MLITKRHTRHAILLLLCGIALLCAEFPQMAHATDTQLNARLLAGKNIYRQGVLPNGETVEAQIRGDVNVSGDQVRCSSCHRRSGLGSTEGQTAVPAVAGDILFNPLQLPTSMPGNAPILRQAYDRESLKRAINEGYGPTGIELDPNMPRYNLSDGQMDLLIDYLKTLSAQIDEGVDDKNIYFATVTSDQTDPEEKQAMMDVFRVFLKQKNTETRHESFRADNAPWHREWIFKPYRKWVLEEWVLKGDPETWGQQLEDYYRQRPVFAVLSGTLPGSWETVHGFCESRQLACLFPTTDLPVISESDFYTVYLDRGVVQEADGLASYLLDEQASGKLIQLINPASEVSVTAGNRFASVMTHGQADVESIELGPAFDWSRLSGLTAGKSSIISWLDKTTTDGLLKYLSETGAEPQIYLSSAFYGSLMTDTPADLRNVIRVIHTHELPSRLTRLLMRSTGWLRANRIYAPRQKTLQANTYFTLKVAGEGLKHMRGFFYRDYLIEKVEKMVDNAPYTSIYPRISMAPSQRYISKGFYITKPSEDGRNLLDLTEWKSPRVFR